MYQSNETNLGIQNKNYLPDSESLEPSSPISMSKSAVNLTRSRYSDETVIGSPPMPTRNLGLYFINYVDPMLIIAQNNEN